MIPIRSFERRKTMRWAFAFIWVAIQVVSIPPLFAQAVGPVSTRFGVDTSIAEVGAIVTVMRAYLAHPNASDYRSEWWSTRDERDRLSGDLTATLAYQGYPATIVGVMGTDAGDSLYVVKTLYARADSNRSGGVRALALQRLYAVREAGEWRLSNALPRMTRRWQRLQAGRITYWYEPGQEAHPDAVRRAGRFVDSVAALFGVTPPAKLDYYVTGSIDAAYRIIGLEFFVVASGPSEEFGGAHASPRAGIVLSGNPALGDAYLHELVHATLGASQTSNYMLGEGMATWLGGAHGLSYREMVSFLRQYQLDHPTVRLDDLLRWTTRRGSGQRRHRPTHSRRQARCSSTRFTGNEARPA